MTSKESEKELEDMLDYGSISLEEFSGQTHSERIDWSKVSIGHEFKFFLVKIRISNGRTFLVKKVPIQNYDSMEEEEEELFNHYYQKLNKRYFHIQKPNHRVFRTSIIDELYIDRSNS